MYMRFIKHTFGLKNHPKVAKVVAFLFSVVIVGGVVALVLQ